MQHDVAINWREMGNEINIILSTIFIGLIMLFSIKEQ